MTPRARRWLAAAAAVVLLLFSGRWLVTFLADRWWAAAISPEALGAVERWHLLGLLLDAGAVLVASAWFAGQALLVARSIGSVQVEHRIGELRVREAVPIRLLLLGAIGTGVLLGLLTGAGARSWRAPVALAWQGLRYGTTDPLLGVDLGILVARYPVLALAHQFATLLVVLGLAFTLLLYAGIGAVRRRDGRLELHPDARRHLGGLLTLLALVIAAGYFLAPYRLATALDVPLGAAAAATRLVAAQAAAGAAIAVALITAAWALRSRHSLLAASWVVMGLAALTERLVVPAFVAEASAGDLLDDATRRLEGVFYGITLAGTAAGRDSVPTVTAIWDEPALASWSAHRGGVFVGATPVVAAGEAGWLVASHFPGEPGSLELTAVAAGVLTPEGYPVPASGDTAHRSLVRAPRSLPGAPDWRPVAGGRGVTVGGVPRRLAMAWARQAPGILRLAPDRLVDWRLGPAERVEQLVPGLTWRVIGLAEHDGRLAWLVGGLATVTRAPLTARVAFDGRQVAGIVPAMVATVHADDGETAIYLDPSADSLGHAWARAVGPLVESAAAMPGWLLAALPYPEEWFEAQLAVLGRPHWAKGQRPGDPELAGLARHAVVWGATGPRRQVALEDPARQVPVTLVEASRQGGVAVLTLSDLSEEDLPGRDEQARSWRGELSFTQLRDSVRAAGDTLLAGPLRHHLGPLGVVSWQVFRSAGRRGDPAVVWIATAAGSAVGGGRNPAAAWAAAFGRDSSAAGGVPFDLASRFAAIRGWLHRADSALSRGDLTAFARAWEAVRGLMIEPPRE